MVTETERIIDCIQGDADWFRARLGCVTSSRVADVVAKRKPRSEKDKELVAKGLKEMEELAGRRDMRYELACELLSGKASEHYVSRWMKEGKEKEPEARVEYELKMGEHVRVRQIGFIYHPTIARAGASPDCVVAEDGLAELKCPTMETHFGYLVAETIPDEYIPQMCLQLACFPDRLWNDFVSYCPAFPAPWDVFIKRMHRTKEVDAYINSMELDIVKFNAEVDELLRRIKGA